MDIKERILNKCLKITVKDGRIIFLCKQSGKPQKNSNKLSKKNR